MVRASRVGGSVAGPPGPSWSWLSVQSLAKRRSNGSIGFPVPGAALALAVRPAHPVFLPPPVPRDATPWAFLSSDFALLHGSTSSLRQRPLGRWHLSWGLVPFSAPEKESPRPPGRSRWGAPEISAPGCAGGPMPPTTVPLAGFLNLSATLFLSRPTRHVSGGWRSWGLPSRGLVLPYRPGGSSPPACPHDVVPEDWPVPS